MTNDFPRGLYATIIKTLSRFKKCMLEAFTSKGPFPFVKKEPINFKLSCDILKTE
ncbi:MAG: hypothetical protein ACLUEV_07865 [Alistipes sp.]